MLTRNGDRISRTDPHRHKFSDAMAEYLYGLSLDGGPDEEGGDVESATGWYGRFGKRILFEDSQGFVRCETWKDEILARIVTDRLHAIYGACIDKDEEAADRPDGQLAHLVLIGRVLEGVHRSDRSGRTRFA